MTTNQFTDQIEKLYSEISEKKLTNRRFKHRETHLLINNLKSNGMFEVDEIGKSTEGRSVYMIKAGNGETKVLLWSQMHGNEPTATAALFDIFNLFLSGFLKPEVDVILKNLTLYFVPMVNPDGAEVFKRRNALDIDLNRDAARLAAVETRFLKKLRDVIEPEYGFNLHDQEIYYSAGNTSNPAAISFLAPSFDPPKTIDDGRKASMQLIVLMNNILQQYIPGMVGRYSDEFMPTAFGDNMQKWGTNTILIESGGYKNDPEKQLIRKMNFLCIMAALYALAADKNNLPDFNPYFKIPENKKEKLFDLLIRNAQIQKNNRHFKIDIGIRRKELDNERFTDFTYLGEISEIGDLSYYFGFEELDASELLVVAKDVELLIGKHADFQLVDKNNKIRYKIKNGFLTI